MHNPAMEQSVQVGMLGRLTSEQALSVPGPTHSRPRGGPEGKMRRGYTVSGRARAVRARAARAGGSSRSSTSASNRSGRAGPKGLAGCSCPHSTPYQLITFG